jgi:transcriptional regulator with XRE-family HTH domain
MTSVPLKLELGKLIKSGLRAADLRQLDLAQHLQISTSAVSQMLNGKTAPTAVHLNKIFQLLNCRHNQIFVMRDLLARIRSGIHELRSPVNEFIMSSRKMRGLSMAKLANLSKIPVSELQILETCSTVAPSNNQVIALAKVLEFEEVDIQRLLNDLPLHGSDFHGNGVQEQGANYERISNTPVKTPVITVKNMLKFNPALEDIKNFVWRNYDKVISAQSLDDSIDYDNVFAIVASGENFIPSLPGTVRLIVAMKNLPETNDTVIVKFKNNDKLQLKRYVVEEDCVFLMPFVGPIEQHGPKTNNFEWVRKVLKVVISSFVL